MPVIPSVTGKVPPIPEDSAVSRMVETLIPIWQRVLRRGDIKASDNFFALGGDAESAFEIFEQIDRAGFGSHSPVLICRAPTVESLAPLLSGAKQVPCSGAFGLRAGIETNPIFLTHGLAGNILELLRLASRLDTEKAVYAVQARGSDGLEPPCDTIEEMADFCMHHIVKIQRHGPYFLVGYSQGGLVMMELARRLLAKGETIALLTMIDTYPDLRYAPLAAKLRLHYRIALQRYDKLRRSGLACAAKRLLARLGMASADELHEQHEQVRSLSPAMKKVRVAGLRTLAKYQPRFYPGRVRFLQAEMAGEYLDDPRGIWEHWCNRFDVDVVPGGHYSMLNQEVKALGDVLSRDLQEAEGQLRKEHE